MYLSKSQILCGLQCQKRLHMALHHPERGRREDSAAAVTGRVVERQARLAFAGGIVIRRGAPQDDPWAQTAQCLQDPSAAVLFEAAFQADGVRVFVDVLERAGAGWNLIEIKAGTRVEDRHIDDVAIQTLTLTRSGVPLKRIELMHIDKAFEYPGGQDYAGLFRREDIGARVQRHLAATAADIRRLQGVAAGPEPLRHVGPHCQRPWPCPFRAYCGRHDAEYPVSLLPNAKAALVETLLARGISDLREVPADELASETHQRVRRITVAGVAERLPAAVGELTGLGYPLCYLDFECIQFAVPVWRGTHPYDQIPFQWSCHLEGADGSLSHHEFLDTSGADPRRAFAEALLAASGAGGPILVYNQSFEKRVIRELAEHLPAQRAALLALLPRIVDLLPIVKRNYYHPDMRGSWSIKSVLPCLVPELSYAGLGEVRDGTQAQQAYFDLISGERAAPAAARLRQDLLDYCRLDTWAMLAMVRRLCDQPVPDDPGERAGA